MMVFLQYRWGNRGKRYRLLQLWSFGSLSKNYFNEWNGHKNEMCIYTNDEFEKYTSKDELQSTHMEYFYKPQHSHLISWAFNFTTNSILAVNIYA